MSELEKTLQNERNRFVNTSEKCLRDRKGIINDE